MYELKWIWVFFSQTRLVLFLRHLKRFSMWFWRVFRKTVRKKNTQLYTWVEEDTVRVTCFTQEHNRMAWAGLQPRQLSRVHKAHHKPTTSLREIKREVWTTSKSTVYQDSGVDNWLVCSYASRQARFTKRQVKSFDKQTELFLDELPGMRSVASKTSNIL